MKKVVILVDNGKRDLLTCKLLERSFLQHGLKVVLCHKRNVVLKLIQEMPDALLVSRCDYPYVVQAAKVCKIFLYPGEGGRLTKESALGPFIGYNKESLYDLSFLSKAYVWGERVKSWLLDTGYFQEEQLSVVGNNKLDIYSLKKSSSKIEPLEPFTLGIAFTAKSTSSYAGSINFVNTYYTFSAVQDTRYAVLNEGYNMEEYVWRDHSVLRIIITLLRKLLETTNISFSIRVGPFENRNHYEFLQKLYPNRIIIENDNQLIPEWINKIDAVLTCWSTIGLEALVNSKPVISVAYILDNDHLFKAFKYEANGFKDIVPCYYTPKSIEDALVTIARLKNRNFDFTPNKNAVDSVLQDIYNWPRDHLSSDLIAKDIQDILNKSLLQKSTKKEFYDALAPRIMKYSLFLPLSLNIYISLFGRWIIGFYKDILSQNYVGNRKHYMTKNSHIDMFLNEL